MTQPLSWLTDYTLNTNEIFVEPVFERLYSDGSPCGLLTFLKRKIFNINELYEFLARSKRTLIQGDAGMGKSTFCRQLAQQWALGTTKEMKAFDLCLVYYLSAWQEEETSLEGEILKQFNLTEETMTKIIREEKPEILLVLDGLDEIVEQRVRKAKDFLKDNGPLLAQKAQIVITSRSVSPESPNDKEILGNFAHLFKIKELSADMQMQLVKRYFRERAEGEAIEKVKEFLNILYYSKQAFTPLLVFIVCFLSQNYKDSPKSSPKVLTERELLKMLFYFLAKNCCKRLKLNLKEEKIETIFMTIGEFFFKTEYKANYQQSELEKAFGDHYKFVTTLGIFSKVVFSETACSPPIVSFQISQKVLYDYLKIDYVCKAARDNSSIMHNYFERDLAFHVGLTYKANPLPVYLVLIDTKERQFRITWKEDDTGRSVNRRIIYEFSDGRIPRNFYWSYLFLYSKKFKFFFYFNLFFVFVMILPFPGDTFGLLTIMPQKNAMTRLVKTHYIPESSDLIDLLRSVRRIPICGLSLWRGLSDMSIIQILYMGLSGYWFYGNMIIKIRNPIKNFPNDEE